MAQQNSTNLGGKLFTVLFLIIGASMVGAYMVGEKLKKLTYTLVAGSAKIQWDKFLSSKGAELPIRFSLAVTNQGDQMVTVTGLSLYIGWQKHFFLNIKDNTSFRLEALQTKNINLIANVNIAYLLKTFTKDLFKELLTVKNVNKDFVKKYLVLDVKGVIVSDDYNLPIETQIGFN